MVSGTIGEHGLSRPGVMLRRALSAVAAKRRLGHARNAAALSALAAVPDAADFDELARRADGNAAEDVALDVVLDWLAIAASVGPVTPVMLRQAAVGTLRIAAQRRARGSSTDMAGVWALRRETWRMAISPLLPHR